MSSMQVTGLMAEIFTYFPLISEVEVRLSNVDLQCCAKLVKHNISLSF